MMIRCQNEQAVAEERMKLLVHIDELQKELDGIIAKEPARSRAVRNKTRTIQQELVPLKRNYNTLAPISRLPVELFSIILMLCRRLKSGPYARTTQTDIGRIAVINVSHTCHMWRTLALSYPQVWADMVDFRGPSYFMACIKRSQKVPIAVRFNTRPALYYPLFPVSAVKQGLRAIRREFCRISKLSISCQPDLAHQVFHLDQQPKHKLPLLTNLEINLRSLNRTWPPKFPFTQWLLAHDIPHLKYLTVDDSSFRWWQCRNFAPGLTHLSINMFGGIGTHQHCTWGEVLECIGQLHALEVLELHGALPRVTTEEQDIPGSKMIALPHLELLSITASISSAVYLSCHLHLPSTTAIHISGTIDNEGEESEEVCSGLVPFIRGETALQSNSPMVSFGITQDRMGLGFANISFFCSREYSPFLYSLITHDWHLKLEFWSMDQDLLPISDVFDSIHDSLNSIQVLWLEEIDFLDMESFLAMFGAASGLNCLGLSNTNALMLPELLLSTPEGDSDEEDAAGPETKRKFIFPELNDLTISDFIFKGSRLGGLEEDTFFEELVEMIKTRKEHGIGPYTIYFQECPNFSEKDNVVRERLASLVSILDTSNPRPPGSDMDMADEMGTYDEEDFLTNHYPGAFDI
ncbi:hypothetical protein QCA50_000180 [Cerrena zonata]|uniref:F-box domain-containing protein n=1 Tax=Cerrena zonata TaxID=2478898 RepID=A0AAW0GZP9_9APHY